MTDEKFIDEIDFEATPVEVDAEETDTDNASELAPQHGVGPFSIREVTLIGVWLFAFVVSFFPVTATLMGGISVQINWGSVWTTGLGWILPIGLPTVAVFLIVLRRLSPDGIRRVGSLGVDQFASVAFSVSAVLWLATVWETVAFAVETGVWVRSWVMWIELLFMLLGVVLTVLAPFIPTFSEDFAGRRDVPAHNNARPIRAITARPAPEPAPYVEPAPYADDVVVDDAQSDGYDPADPYATGSAGAAAAYDADATGAIDPITVAQPIAEPAAEARQQAFWALSPEERDVVDELGIPLFRVGPTAWALVIEERDEVFVVRHEDGRVGYLHDISGVTRG